MTSHVGDRPVETGSSRPGRSESAAFIGVLVIFWALAIGRLDATTLWVDETFSLAATNHLWMSLTSTGATMAAYYVLLWPWAKVSDATWWLRIFSTLAAVPTLLLVRVIGRRIGGRWLGTVASLLLVSSPIFLWMSTEARSYSLEILLTTCAWYVMIRAIESSEAHGTGFERRWSVLLIAIGTVGPLIHGLFFTHFIAVGSLCLVDRRSRRHLRPLAWAIGACITVTALIRFVQGAQYQGATTVGSVAHVARYEISFFFSPVGWIAWSLVVATVIALGTAIWKASRPDVDVEHRLNLLVPTIWTVIPLLVLIGVRQTYGTFTAYYLSPIAPGLALLLGSALCAAGRRVAGLTRSSAIRAAGASAAAVFGVALFVGQSTHNIATHEDWRGATRLVAGDARPGDAILFAGNATNAGSSRTGFEAAWRETAHSLTPRAISPARPLGKVQRTDHYLSNDQIVASASTATRVWVIDYQGFIPPLHILDHRPFTTEFNRSIDKQFAGGITVMLYSGRLDPP